MRNHRLDAALRTAGMTGASLAAAVDVAPRSVTRWLTDDSCRPRTSTANLVAQALGTTAGELWVLPGCIEPVDELVALYPSRASVPAMVISDMICAAVDQVDIIAVSGLSMWEGVDGLIDLLAAKAAGGVQIRIMLADPEASSLSERGALEGVGELVRARPQLAWAALRTLRDRANITLAMHTADLPAAIVRGDDQLLVNLHVVGMTDAAAPVLHLRRQQSSRLAEAYLTSIDVIANRAHPLSSTSANRVSRRTPATLRPVAGSGA